MSSMWVVNGYEQHARVAAVYKCMTVSMHRSRHIKPPPMYRCCEHQRQCQSKGRGRLGSVRDSGAAGESFGLGVAGSNRKPRCKPPAKDEGTR
jgi:hypothetical protein